MKIEESTTKNLWDKEPLLKILPNIFLESDFILNKMSKSPEGRLITGEKSSEDSISIV